MTLPGFYQFFAALSFFFIYSNTPQLATWRLMPGISIAFIPANGSRGRIKGQLDAYPPLDESGRIGD